MIKFGDTLGDYFSKAGNWIKNNFNYGWNVLKNTAVGLWNDWTGNTANRENIEYQKEYNQEVFNRADTQYQRTVADLRSAGLSAQLASGTPSTVSGASAAPQRTVGNESAAIDRLVGMINAIKQTNSNVNLASAQADEAKAKAADAAASAALKGKEYEGFDSYRAMELTVMGSSASLNNAYTRLAQIDGQTRAAKNLADIQNTMKNTKYLNSLINLAEKNLDLVDSEIARNKADAFLTGSKVFTEFSNRQVNKAQIDYLNKEIDYLTDQIVAQVIRNKNVSADTQFIIQQTANASLKYTIDAFTFKFKTGLGDSPDSTEVSSTQSAESKKAFKRELALGIVKNLTNVVTGLGTGFAIGLGAKGGTNFLHKMLGIDDHGPYWNR